MNRLPEELQAMEALRAMGVAEESTTTTKIRPREAPLLLGGQLRTHGNRPHRPATDHNPPLAATVFRRLPRPAPNDLPGIRTNQPSDNGTALAYRRMYRGDLAIECHVLTLPPPCSRSYAVKAVLPEDGDNDNRGAMHRYHGPLLAFVATIAPPQGFQINRVIAKTDAAKAFVDSLQEDQLDALHYRFLHLFLRTHGVNIEREIFQFLSQDVRIFYSKRKWYKEALDVCILTADVSIRQGLDTPMIVWDLMFVGECLAGMGDYGRSSLVYREIIDLFWDPSCASRGHEKVQLPNLCNCAAFFTKTVGDYETAEALYLKALHHDLATTQNRNDWAKVDPVWLTNMSFMYLDWQEAHMREWQQSENAKEPMLPLALKSLLFCVGRTDVSHFGLQGPTTPEGQPKYSQEEIATVVLFPAYNQQKNLALQALTRAVSKPDSVTHFRSVILDCCRVTPADFRSQLSNLQDDAATRTAGQKIGTASCGNGACPNVPRHIGKLLRCPCRTIMYVSANVKTEHRGVGIVATFSSRKSLLLPVTRSYPVCLLFAFMPPQCCKSCQRADWPRHKQGCSYHKSKKPAKTEAHEDRQG